MKDSPLNTKDSIGDSPALKELGPCRNCWPRNAAALGKSIRIILCLFLLCSAAKAETLGGLRDLQIGESASFAVRSADMNNASGIVLRCGAHYQFTVDKCDTWKDAKIVCSAGGWTSNRAPALLRPLVKAAEKNRRFPSANWFELIGFVGNECKLIRIGCRGCGWSYRADRDGQFYAFANDLCRKYGNNSGCITLTVTRLPQAAKPLPTCQR